MDIPGKGGRGTFFRADSLQKLGVEEVTVENYDDWDSDEEEKEIARPGDEASESALMNAPAPTGKETTSEMVAANPLLYTSSFVKSMSEYAFRRDVILQKIVEGDVRDKMSPTGRDADKRDQVALEFYTDENQARRRHIKKHPQFIAIVRRLWSCIDLLKTEGGCLTKDAYTGLSFKITLLIVPPPIDPAQCKKAADEDWVADTKGAGELSYEAFFASMFQLVDTWTESCNAEDYVETLLRLIDGICLNEDGGLHFKKDEQIQFDKFFSFMGDVKKNSSGAYKAFHDEEDEDEEVSDARANEHMCDRARRAHITCATEHMCDIAGRRGGEGERAFSPGVRGVSPRQPPCDPLTPQTSIFFVPRCRCFFPSA
jgi:hypothetical protein